MLEARDALEGDRSARGIVPLSLVAHVLRAASLRLTLDHMTSMQAEREALWERLGDQFKADVGAAIERVHEAMPDDPGNASGVVEIALRDLADEHCV